MPTTHDIAPYLSPGELVTAAEAAEILKVSVQTLSNWRWRQIGPRTHKLGGRSVRYRLSDLTAFVERGASDCQ